MRFVIDANIIMGMLISGKASYLRLLRHYLLITPSFSLDELEKYQNIVRDKTKQDERQLLQYSVKVFTELNVFPHFFLSNEAKIKAAGLVLDIDPKDFMYVATALEFDLVLLTNDKPLVSGLKKKGFRKVMLWSEFLKKQI